MSKFSEAIDLVWNDPHILPAVSRENEKLINEGRAEVAQDAEKLRGDIHHLISPIIGLLRAAEHHKEPLTEKDFAYAISRLCVALSLMDEAVVGTAVPIEIRGKHGLGLSHYPSLVDPDASPCIRAPHWEKS